jgi:hypothetical protein
MVECVFVRHFQIALWSAEVLDPISSVQELLNGFFSL